MALMGPEQLELLLGQLLQPDTVRAAEATLNRAMKAPQFIIELAERLRHSQSPHVRQYAAVLMRRRISAHWSKLDAATQHALKATLLESVTAEPAHLVRVGVAGVVTVIAKHTLPRGEWNELFAGLFQCSRSAAEDQREVAMLLLTSLLEAEEVVECLRPHFETLCSVLHTALGDSSAAVARAALKAVGAWAMCILESSDDARLLKPMLPAMLQVCGRAVSLGDEETAKLGCGILDDCVESPAGVVNPHLAAILAFASDTAKCRSLEKETCASALNLLATCVVHKRKLVVKQRLVPPLVLVLFEICAEIEELDEDEDELSLHKLAAQVLDVLGRHLPSKHVVPPLLEQVGLHRASDCAYRRRAVLVSLAVTAEGCSEAFVARLDDLLPLLYAGCADPSQMVREAACIGIGQFAQFLQPEIITHYQQVLPCIFTVLNDATEQVKEKSCYALEAFCEHLGEDIVPFLQPLLARLSELLQHGSRKTQEMCVSAIASVAMAAADKFTPYFAQVYSLMRVLLGQTGEQELLLRARAMECVGLMNLAVGREHCEPVLPECTELALAGLELGLPELKEYTYGFFAQTAELVGAECAGLLPRLLPFLLASLNAEDSFDWQAEGGEGEGDGEGEGEGGADGLMRSALASLNGGGGGGGGGGDEDEDEDEGDEGGGGGSFSVRTSLLDEKAAAAHTLGAIAEHGGAALHPHLEPCLAALLAQEDYFHEDVRCAVAKALRALVQVCVAVEGAAVGAVPTPPPPGGGKPPAGPPPLLWVKGGAADGNALPPLTRSMLERVLPPLVSRLQLDDDKDTVAAASEAIADVAKLVGPPAVAARGAALAQVVMQLLQQAHPCQTAGGEADELGVDDEADHDEALWEAVSELLTSLPKVLGAAWQPHFASLLPHLLPYLGAGHPASDRSLAVGVIAESMHQLEAEAAPLVAVVMPIALRHSADEDATCRQNATFCLGVMSQYCPGHTLGHMQSILTALQPRLAAEEEHPVRDNAVGALGRLALGHGAALPLDGIVTAMLAQLPLTADCGENTPAVRALMQLTHAEATRAVMAPHVPALLSALGRGLKISSAADTQGDKGDVDLLGAELRGEVTLFLQWLASQVPAEQLAAATASLPEAERAVLASSGLCC